MIAILVAILACLFKVYLETRRGIGYDTPEAAVKGFYMGLRFGNAEKYVDPEIRDTPEGRALLDLYDPTQFSGYFGVYGRQHAGKIDRVTLETADTLSQTETRATLRVSGTFGAVSDLGTVLLQFGSYTIDDTVYLIRREERWFLGDIEVHSGWLRK